MFFKISHNSQQIILQLVVMGTIVGGDDDLRVADFPAATVPVTLLVFLMFLILLHQ